MPEKQKIDFEKAIKELPYLMDNLQVFQAEEKWEFSHPINLIVKEYNKLGHDFFWEWMGGKDESFQYFNISRPEDLLSYYSFLNARAQKYDWIKQRFIEGEEFEFSEKEIEKLEQEGCDIVLNIATVSQINAPNTKDLLSHLANFHLLYNVSNIYLICDNFYPDKADMTIGTILHEEQPEHVISKPNIFDMLDDKLLFDIEPMAVPLFSHHKDVIEDGEQLKMKISLQPSIEFIFGSDDLKNVARCLHGLAVEGWLFFKDRMSKSQKRNEEVDLEGLKIIFEEIDLNDEVHQEDWEILKELINEGLEEKLNFQFDLHFIGETVQPVQDFLRVPEYEDDLLEILKRKLPLH